MGRRRAWVVDSRRGDGGGEGWREGEEERRGRSGRWSVLYCTLNVPHSNSSSAATELSELRKMKKCIWGKYTNEKVGKLMDKLIIRFHKQYRNNQKQFNKLITST